MHDHFRSAKVAVATLCLMLASTPCVAAEPAPTCESSKLKTAGKNQSCQLAADAKAVKAGDAADFTKCDEKFADKWQGAEEKAGVGVCPSEGDQEAIGDFLSLCNIAIDRALAGATLPGCLGISLPLTTDQTTCYDESGDLIACAGTGHDGDHQKGLERSFTDNGDGTISDTVTGLMWEKLSDDGSVHAEGNSFAWADTGTKIAALNAASFAGHNDWRVPNINELRTLANFSLPPPAVYPPFNTGCVPGCTVLTCDCYVNEDVWSSTTVGWTKFSAFALAARGNPEMKVKTVPARVRAVRGGI